MVTPAVKRKAASVMITEFRRSQRRACELSGLRRSTCRYRSHRSGDDELRQKLREIALQRPPFGYRRLGYFLRKDGLRFNHKRLLRLYRSEGLACRASAHESGSGSARSRFCPPSAPTSAGRSTSSRISSDRAGAFASSRSRTTTRASGPRRSSTPRSARRESCGARRARQDSSSSESHRLG
jgi:hypothetical protein